MPDLSDTGDVSPANSTIRVARPGTASPAEGPRPKKLKLTVRKPIAGDEMEVAPSRPKRNVVRPVRYSPEEPRPAVKPRKNSESSPMLVSDSESETTLETPEEDEPAPYSADFLAMFIEDDSPVVAPKPPPPPPPALKAPIPRKRKYFRPAIEETPKATPLLDSLETPAPGPPSSRQLSTPFESPYIQSRPVSQPPPPSWDALASFAPPFAHAPPLQAPAGAFAFVTEQPHTIDSPEVIIKKLSVAVHAMGGLNIPPPPLLTSEQPVKKEPGIDALLSAAAGSDPVEGNDYSSCYIGSMDMDIRILIQHAIHLLRSSKVAKAQHLQATSKPRGRPKRDVGIASLIEADRFAISALENVSKSSALNINCIISPRRANLTWVLYMSLLFLLTPPPPQHQPHQQYPQHPMPHMNLPYSAQSPAAIEAAMAAAHAHQQQGGHGTPPPHQFLLRDAQNHGASPGPGHGPSPSFTPTPPPAYNQAARMNGPHMSHPTMDTMRMYTPGYLPRSGQSMKFSFPPNVHMPAMTSPGGPAGGSAPSSAGMGPPPGAMWPAHPFAPHPQSQSQSQGRAYGLPYPLAPMPVPVVMSGALPAPPGGQRPSNNTIGYPHPDAVVIEDA